MYIPFFKNTLFTVLQTFSIVILVSAEKDPRCLFELFQNGLCHDCSADFYRESGVIDQIDPNLCTKRFNSTLRLETFIKSSPCLLNEACNGSAAYPFDTIGKALANAHKESNKYNLSYIQFYLLGKTHYVLRNSIPESSHYFFSGIKANVEISPCLCSFKALTGCFTSTNLKANIIIKSPDFTLFSSKSLTLSRLAIEATDIYLINATDPLRVNDCANQERICCDLKSLETDFKKFPCGIVNRPLNFQPLNKWKEFFGLINLKPILPEESKYYEAPALFISECSFDNFFPSNDTKGWVSLIMGSANSGSVLEIVNSTFSNFRLLKGILWLSENQEIFPSLKYNEENLYFNVVNAVPALLVKNSSFGKYDTYKNYGQPEGNENSLFIIKSMKGAVLFLKCNFSNLTNNKEVYKFFTVKECNNFKLIETNFLNNRNFSIMNIETSFHLVHNCTFKNMSFNDGFVILDTHLMINFSLIDTISKNSFLKNFLWISGGELEISRTVISNNVKIGILVYNCKSFILSDCSILNHNMLTENFFELYSTPLIFTRNTINNLRETSYCNLFLIDNLGSQTLNHFIDSLYITRYKMYDYNNCIFSFDQNYKNDSLNAFGIFIEKSDIGNVILTRGISLVNLFNTTLNRMTLESLGTTVLWTTYYMEINIENLVINSLYANYMIISVDLCNAVACYINLKTFSLQKLIIDYEILLYFQGTSKLIIENGIIDDPYTLINPIFSFNFFSELNTNDISVNGIVINFYRLTCTNIFNLSPESLSIKNIIMNQSSTSYQTCSLCQMKLFGYSKYFTLSNISLYNVIGSIIVNSFANDNFKGISNINLTMNNVYFINCSKTDFGLIYIVNVQNISLSTISIENSPDRPSIGIRGGALKIVYAANVKVNNFKINYFETEEYAGAFFKQVSFIIMTDCEFNNTKAKFKGGAIGILNVAFFNGVRITIKNSQSQDDGGAFYIQNSIVNLSYIIAKDLITESLGGFIYLSYGTLNLTYSNFRGLKSISGGLIYFENGELLHMEYITFTHSEVSSTGVFAELTKINEVILSGLIVDNINCPGAIGIIFMKSYEPNYLTFFDIIINNTNVRTGSFLSLESNSRVKINNLEVSASLGIAISMISKLSSTIDIVNISAFKNGINSSTLSNLIVVHNTNLTITGESYIRGNLFSFSVIFASYSNITIEKIIFYQNQFKSSEQIASIINLENSKAKLVKINYTEDEGPLYFSSLLNAKASEIYLEQSIIANCRSSGEACILMNLGILQVSGSIFKNNEGSIAGSIYLIGTDAEMSRSSFSLGVSRKKYDLNRGLNSLYVPNSAIEIFVVDSSTPQQSVLFKNVKFKARDKNIPVVLFSKVFAVEIQYCEIRPLSESEPGLGIVFEGSNTKISFSSFIELTSLAGSAIRFINQDPMEAFKNMEIYQSQFRSNTANVGGSIILIGKVLAKFENNSFLGNRALNLTSDSKSGIAGCAYYACLECSKASLTLVNNNFEGNSAEYFAPTVFSQAEVFNNSNYFIENFDSLNFTSTISSLPLKKIITPFEYIDDFYRSSNKTSNIMIISGSPFDLNLTLMDNFNQTLIFDQHSKSYLRQLTDSKVLISVEIYKSLNGFHSFRSARIKSKLNTTLLINLDIIFYEDEFLPFILERHPGNNLVENIQTYVRNCTYGELFIIGDSTCELCPENEYSLIDPMSIDFSSQKCQKCPENAVCKSGNFITPVKGYWRAHENSTKILECLAKDSCLGDSGGIGNYSDLELITGKCAENHEGPLCFICTNDLVKLSLTSPCERCENNYIYYLKFVIVFGFIIAYVLIQVKMSLNPNNSFYAGILLKQLLTHFQQISIISILDLGWTSEFRSYFFFQSYISFFSDDLFNFECIFKNADGYPLIRSVTISLILPFLLSCFFLLLFLINQTINYFRAKEFSLHIIISDFKICFIMTGYIFYPEIARKTLSLLNCIELEDYTHSRVLRFSPGIKCWSHTHNDYLLSLALPGLLFWCIFFPLSLSIILYRNKTEIKNIIAIASSTGPAPRTSNFWQESIHQTEKLEINEPKRSNTISSNNKNSDSKEELNMVMRFIYKGYQKDYYYWELVIFIKKIILIFIGSFTDFFPDEAKATILLAILAIFLFLQVRMKPYELLLLNKIEFYSLIITLLTANFGVLLYTEDFRSVSQLLLAVIIANNILYICFWIYALFALKKKSKSKIYKHKI